MKVDYTKKISKLHTSLTGSGGLLAASALEELDTHG